MNQEYINNLKEALLVSPGNIPLRQLLATALVQANQLPEAEKEYLELVRLSSDAIYRYGLARVFFLQQKYSQCNVILEELIHAENAEAEVFILYAKALYKEDEFEAAVESYKKALALDPTRQDPELDQQLRMGVSYDMDMPEDMGNDPFLERPDINFEHVGGMDQVKKEIGLKIIQPLKHPELYKAYGKKTGGGILLYGPPGCGKTFIARATAGEVNAQFISVALSDILDMWIGSSEKNLHNLFEVARDNKPCIIFFDEIDALGASRADMKQSSGRHLINQFLQELDGIDQANEGLLILGATNTPWHLDPAFRRPGRFDRIIFVPPPDAAARESILRLKLAQKPVEDIDYKQLAQKLEHYSGADIEALIDIAIEEKLEASFADGIPKPLQTRDLLNAAKKHRASTQEWFATAKNFALFANDSGLYDDILTYMKIKK